MSTHACVEHQEQLICLAEQAFNFAPRDAGFYPHTNRGKLAQVHPAPDRDGMQSQFLSSLSHPKILSITCSHDRRSITERDFQGNCYSPSQSYRKLLAKSFISCRHLFACVLQSTAVINYLVDERPPIGDRRLGVNSCPHFFRAELVTGN